MVVIYYPLHVPGFTSSLPLANPFSQAWLALGLLRSRRRRFGLESRFGPMIWWENIYILLHYMGFEISIDGHGIA